MPRILFGFEMAQQRKTYYRVQPPPAPRMQWQPAHNNGYWTEPGRNIFVCIDDRKAKPERDCSCSIM